MSENTTSNMSPLRYVSDYLLKCVWEYYLKLSRNTTQIMSENTASKKLGVRPQIVLFIFFIFFKVPLQNCLRVCLYMCSVPPQFYFPYVLKLFPPGFIPRLYCWIEGRSRRYFAHLCVISPCVCSVREIGGVGVGGEDFAFL